MVIRYLLTTILIMACYHGTSAQPLPDSLLTEQAAYRYCFVNPSQSRQIIRTMRDRQLLPEWQLDLTEGNFCFYHCLFHTALKYYTKAYESEAVQSDDALKMRVMNRLMDTYDILFDEKNLTRYAHDLYTLAKSRENNAYMSMALFKMGKRAHYQGKKELGYLRCKEAISLMEHSRFWRKNNMLRAFYGELTFMYLSDKRYEEALRFSEAQEKTACQPHQPAIIYQRERALYRTYAIRTNILLAMGRTAAADSIYHRCVSLPVTDPYIYRNLVVFLKDRQRFAEMLPYLRQAYNILREDKDTLNRNMLLVLSDTGDAYEGMGQFDSATSYYSAAVRLYDKLTRSHSRQLTDAVRESIAVERTLAKRERLQFYIYTGIAVLVVLLLIYFYYTRMVRQKNKRMAQLIHSVMNYRYGALYESGGDEDNQLEELKNDPNWQLFHQADKQVVKNELFRNPDFGRDELMRVMGVDKGTLATIIQRFTGTNVPGYINTKRMEYAIQLIKVHPEYTLSAVSEASGIKSATTFIRHFKNVYGMTPSEYRLQLEDENSTPPILAENDAKSEKMTK